MYIYIMFSIDLSVRPETHATHRGLVLIFITSKTNDYVVGSGPWPRCCCLCYRKMFLTTLLDAQHRFDIRLLV